MEGGGATELILIRHAPALTGGRLCGRTDVAADCSDADRLGAVRRAVGRPDRIVTSPALRCRQTALALWPDLAGCDTEPGLWEQDFGDWEGRDYALLPDLGALSPGALAAHRPPNGESFDDLCARVAPVLQALAAHGGDPVAVVAHAGSVRAVLALALGTAAPALSFRIDPLSLTRVTALPGGTWSVGCVNWTP